MKLLSLALLLALAQSAFAQITIIKIDKKAVPKTIHYAGHIIDVVQYTDNEGQHLMITTETGNVNVTDDEGNAARKSEIYAYNYIVKGDQRILSWQMHDFTGDCIVDTKASYVPKTFSVTDLNNDGKAEVWLMYLVACRGDVSPASMKIVMHEGDKKYAVRGTSKTKVSDKDYDGGEYTLDDAFKAAPTAFKQYALQLWRKNILEKD